MGLINGQCEDFKNLEPENRFAELGVRQDSPSRRETLEIYLMWDEAEDGMPRVSACVSLGFTTKADRNDYAKLLRTIRSIQSGDDPWPYLWTSKKLIDLSSSAEIFGALVSEWLDRWPAGRTFK
jgi:hypothetical protein